MLQAINVVTLPQQALEPSLSLSGTDTFKVCPLESFITMPFPAASAGLAPFRTASFSLDLSSARRASRRRTKSLRTSSMWPVAGVGARPVTPAGIQAPQAPVRGRPRRCLPPRHLGVRVLQPNAPRRNDAILVRGGGLRAITNSRANMGRREATQKAGPPMLDESLLSGVTTVIVDWPSLTHVFDQFGPGWVFRGHASSNWRLRPTLERELIRINGLQGDLDMFSNMLGTAEEMLIEAFRREAASFKDIEYTSGWTDTEVLAFLQHHGAPTRLLDWTASPYIALFFAVEACSDPYCAIWAINAGRLYFEVPEPHAPLQARAVAQFDPAWHRLIDALGVDGRVCGVVPVSPYAVNRRISSQQGLFLTGINQWYGFEYNLAHCIKATPPDYLHKIVIPGAQRRPILERLARLNLTRRTLFPDLQGMVESLLPELEVKWQPFDPQAGGSAEDREASSPK